jgi:F0F1-type ATP synthase delta subunit
MNANLNSVVQKLSNFTQNYAIAQIVGELHIVVERLEFVDFKAQQNATPEAMLAQIAFLLDRDLSPGIMQFVRELIDEGQLGVLLGSEGRQFIGYCDAYFSERKQIIFKTAVHLSREKQRHIQSRLMIVFPISSRIVFEVDQSVGAGFVLLEDGNMLADYSLRSKMVKLLDRRIRERVADTWSQKANQPLKQSAA